MNDTDRRIEDLAQRARRAAPTDCGAEPAWLAARVLASIHRREAGKQPLLAVSLWSLSLSCALVLLCAASSQWGAEANEQDIAALIVEAQLPE